MMDNYEIVVTVIVGGALVLITVAWIGSVLAERWRRNRRR